MYPTEAWRANWVTSLGVTRGEISKKRAFGVPSTMKTVLSGERGLSLVMSLRNEFSIYWKDKGMALALEGPGRTTELDIGLALGARRRGQQGPSLGVGPPR